MPFSESELHASKATIAVCLLTIGACALVAVDLALHRDDIGFVAYPLFCAACVIRVRQFFCKWQRHLDRAFASLDERWTEAFEMGREVGREEQGGGIVRLPSHQS
jgi:hypothetical protein